MRIPNRVVLASLMAATALPALSAEPANLAPAQVLMTSPDAVAAPGIAWQESKSVPAGMKMIVIHGDPSKAGPYVFRAMIPAGYKLPPHRHPDQRSVLVLKGTYWSAAGEEFAQDKLKKFLPGHFYITDAKVPHFAWAETDVIIQEMGMGPVGNPIEFVNMADDPRSK